MKGTIKKTNQYIEFTLKDKNAFKNARMKFSPKDININGDFDDCYVSLYQKDENQKREIIESIEKELGIEISIRDE